MIVFLLRWRYWLLGSLLVLIIVTLLVSGARKAMIKNAPLQEVYFAHMDHKQVPCAKCHHNYVDGSGRDKTCYDCHKRDPEINQHIQEMFHDFCRDCHIDMAAKHEDAGPARQCSACHKPDTKP